MLRLQTPQPKLVSRHGRRLCLRSVTLQNSVSYQYILILEQLYLCLLIATINSCINGYDGSLMGAINSYPQYRKYFNFDEHKGTPATGIVYAIYTIGNLVGSFFAGPATDFRGRKWGMFIGTAIIMVGACVQATCTNLGGFMGGRFVLGFGVAITSTAGPAYVSEMAHPVYRGVCTGVFNTFWYVGGIPGSFVPYGTSKINSTMAWRIPIWLQMIFAGIVLFASPFLPETPRWLIANDRHEEALDTMAKYHGEGSRNSPIVMLEYKEMVEDISVTGSDKRWWDYSVRISCKPTRPDYPQQMRLTHGYAGTLQQPRSPLPYDARPLHGLLWPMVRQRPRVLLLPDHAPRRRHPKQRRAPLLQRHAERRIFRRCSLRCRLHRQMGSTSATPCLDRHARHYLRYRVRACCDKSTAKTRRQLCDGYRRDATGEAAGPGEGSDCVHLHLWIRV